MKKPEPIYALMQDIVIPAGTRIFPAPTRINHFVPYGEAILGHGPDNTSCWSIDLEEGMELGLIKEIT